MEEELIRKAFAEVARPKPAPFLAARLESRLARRRTSPAAWVYWVVFAAWLAWMLPAPALWILVLTGVPLAGLALAVPSWRQTVPALLVPFLRPRSHV